MKLYYFPPSPFARKPRIAAQMLGIQLETQKVDVLAGEGQTPEFLKLNPQGKVPTLVDGDFVLWESNAIVQYLASKAGPSALWPEDPRTRGDIARWQFWESTSLAPACVIFVWENLLKEILNLGAPDPVELKKGEERFHRCAKLLDGHLAQHPWLVGDTMTLADVSLAPVLMYSEQAGYSIAGYDHIRHWFDKFQELPAWAATDPSLG